MKGSFLAVFACAASLVVAGTAHARTACWERVVSDWSADNRISGTYGIGCYREALAKLPEDLRTYSSAPDDIRRGLQKQVARAAVAAQPSARSGRGSNRGRTLVVVALVLGAAVAIAAVVIRG
jgi:hypothetical protein